MIVDGHCHVWENWPYQPPVPDVASRARAEQLLYEMDAARVERAIVICAAIGNNPRNADYAFAAAERHPGRFVIFPDIECRWSPTFRQPGAVRRLEEAIARWSFGGFTLYLDEAEDGSWLTGDEGRDFFAIAAARRMIVSASILPRQMPFVAETAATYPGLRIIAHHHAHLGPRTAADTGALSRVIAAAAGPNMYVKVSGMGNVAAREDEYPYARLAWIAQALRAAYGADRLIWGSDYPVSRRHMTYAQTLAMVTRHGPFDADELPRVLGGTMLGLLDGK
jgi:predicted TIM-barrel fold metal-dependent hydrolase